MIKLLEDDKPYYKNVNLRGTFVKINIESKENENEETQYSRESVLTEPRHVEAIEGLKDIPNVNWRTKERMKTMSAVIVLCLNVGVDPPDIVKPNPCAVMQCWTDPATVPQSNKAAETIATILKKQYERWQPKARYKLCTDPTVEDLKKLCSSLRRTSKEERVLFHYNGHGVPRPTINGEIWVFNRNFTQYIPLSLYDLQQWMGSPSIYVFDCSNAGIIVELFQQFAIQHKKEFELNSNSSNYLLRDDLLNSKASSPPNYENCILLAACDKGENLPLNPELPADLFTSCLTTPIKTFLIWFMKQNSRKLSPQFSADLIDKIPGTTSDRKSILGELNWIFTAITDTIAWNTLPRDLFQKLFRQDLLVASLFRNFLLAQRILRSYDCTPISHPRIKSVHHHPMWNAWDLAVDNCLSQLAQMADGNNDQVYVNSQFFTEQLTAFQVWLKLSSDPLNTPEQLPIVLQVLLSQVHRSRALDLLGNFLNLGPWAVNLALSVGIFPYVLKLLQASARELRPFLVFIWAKILAIDESYQSELIRENAHRYFMNVLSDSNISINHQIMSAFVLSVIVRHNPTGQKIVVQGGSSNPIGSIIDISLLLLTEHQYNHPNLRKWLTICLGNVWENNEDIRWLATRNVVHEKLYFLLEDPVPDVRAAAVYAFGTFLNSISQREEHDNEIDRNIVSTLVKKVFYDTSPLVRKELLVTLHWFIAIFENKFLPLFRKKAYEEYIHLQNSINKNDTSPQNSISSHTPNNIPTNLMNNSINELVLNTNESFTTNMRKISSRDRISNLPTNFTKLLSVPVSINSNDKLSNARQANFNAQLTPPSANNMKRVSSANSLSIYNTSFNLSSSVTTKSITNIFNRVWHVIDLYKTDPHPEVAKMAYIVYNDINSKAFTGKDNNSDSSISEPPSPNNRQSFMSNESPIGTSDKDLTKSTSRTSTPLKETSVKHHSGRVSVSAISSPYLPHSKNYSSFMTQYTMKRTIFGRDPKLDEFSESRHKNGMKELSRDNNSLNRNSLTESIQMCRKPLISTGFVDWCTKHFSEPCTHPGVCSCTNTELNRQDLIKEWKQSLLEDKYKTSLNELHLTYKTNQIKIIEKHLRNFNANLLALHPFEKCAVLADKQTYSIWNYSEDTVKTFSNENELNAQISDLHLINTHDYALLMVACVDGSVRLWRDVLPPTFYNLCIEENNFIPFPKLSTAFYIFEDMPLHYMTHRKPLVLSWNQHKHKLIAGGDCKYLRLWDANKEMKIRDIPTNSEAVSSLSTDNDHLICTGSEDGGIRLFDDRVMESLVQSFTERFSPVVSSKIYSPSKFIDIACGHRSGDICWYDKRHCKAVRVESLGSPITAMDFHDHAEVFACVSGSENSEVKIYTKDTMKGSTMKFRNLSIKSIAFHSLKAQLAIATSDSTVSIFNPPFNQKRVYTF